MNISKLEHIYTVVSREGFMVVKYKAKNPVSFPDGSAKAEITAVGKNLPEIKGVFYEMSGDFELYEDKKTGKARYSFKVQDVCELIPSDEDGIKAYLRTFKTVDLALADQMLSSFGKDIFRIIEKEPAKLRRFNTVTSKKAQKIHGEFLLRTGGRKLSDYLTAFSLKENQILRIYQQLGPDAYEIIKKNPYEIVFCGNVGFSKADFIARKEGFTKDNEKRIEAGILEVLSQSERGGNLFARNSTFPDFMLNSYLRKPVFNLIEEETT